MGTFTPNIDGLKHKAEQAMAALVTATHEAGAALAGLRDLDNLNAEEVAKVGIRAANSLEGLQRAARESVMASIEYRDAKQLQR